MKRLEYYVIGKKEVDNKEYGYPGYSNVVRVSESENLGKYISRVGRGLYSSDVVDETDEVIVWWVTFNQPFDFDYPSLKEWYVVEMKEVSK